MGAYVFLIVVALESIISGLTIGVQTSHAKVWIILIAVLCHDWAECISLSIYFIESHGSRKKKRLYAMLVMFSTCTSIGVSLGAAVQSSMSAGTADKFASALAAFTAGAFLFIATIEMIGKEFSSSYVSGDDTGATDETEMKTLVDSESNTHDPPKLSKSDIEQTRHEILIKMFSVIIGFALPTISIILIE
jgi:zinc transporter ZupT